MLFVIGCALQEALHRACTSRADRAEETRALLAEIDRQANALTGYSLPTMAA